MAEADLASDWQQVVFADECDELGNCPLCLSDYTECPCPGPSMDEAEWEYRTAEGTQSLQARKIQG
tara:strand:+ start:1354 stop:1551 length:198 start_codon:yes stop_codon:yes gene_type:complete